MITVPLRETYKFITYQHTNLLPTLPVANALSQYQEGKCLALVLNLSDNIVTPNKNMKK